MLDSKMREDFFDGLAEKRWIPVLMEDAEEILESLPQDPQDLELFCSLLPAEAMNTLLQMARLAENGYKEEARIARIKKRAQIAYNKVIAEEFAIL